MNRTRETLAGTPIPLFLAALVPPAVVLPLRLLAFGDGDPFTLVLLGPAAEEGLKLAALLLALTLAGLWLPRGHDPANALRYWLFFAPWLVGGLYGMVEGIAIYPGQSTLDYTLREFAHGTFVALSLAEALYVWRELDAPYVGVALGFGAGWAAHILFNEIAVLSAYADVTFLDQVVYTVVALVLAAVALGRVVAREPASPTAERFLAVRGGLRT